MKSNKLLLGLLGASIIINIIVLFFNSDGQQSATQTTSVDTTSSDLTQLPDETENSLLFGQELNLDEINSDEQDSEQLQALKKKITILATQNKVFQKQIEEANQKQADIVAALTTIVDKIDSQLLMPPVPTADFQPSNYNMDFNTIPKSVVKKCMDLTTVASAKSRYQQKQTREQQLLNEETDTIWSSEIESQIQSVLSNDQLHDSSLVSLNCKTTICQITIQHNSPSAKKLFEVPFFSNFQQSVSQYDETFDKATNQSTGIFYLTRNKEN